MVRQKRINNDKSQRLSGLQANFLRLSEQVIEILLVSLLAFMPLAFGAVQSWSQEVVVIVSCCILFVFLLRQLICSQGFVSTWAYVPLAAFIFLAIFTIIPMPQNTVSALSSQTVELKTELLTDTIKQSENTTLSFYPYGTKSDLRVMLSAFAIFFVVLNVFKSSVQIKRLLKAIVIIGAVVAFLAIVQNIIGNGKIYGFISSPRKAISGPFVNHSHFGQFMNLSIGAALSLILLILHREFKERQATAAAVFEYFDSSRAKELWLLATMISMSAAAIFVSLTRGGVISMIIAMCITVLLLSARRAFRQHGWIVVIIALAALICLLYTGFDTVYERFATLGALDRYGTRLAILKDMVEPTRRFALFGTGLGSYAVVYPMFQSIYTALRFSHAENEYAQLLLETGLTGFILMLTFGAVVIVNFIKAIRNKKSEINVSAYGLGFGLVAILTHSVADFGQHLPANLTLTAIFCALIITLGKRSTDIQYARSARLSKPVILVLSVILVCIYGWALAGSDKARKAENQWLKAWRLEAKLRAFGLEDSDNDFEKLIAYATQAGQIQPDNIEYSYWVNVWKWWDISRNINPETGELPNESIGMVYSIADELKEIRKICPTFGPTYCLLGQLQKFVLFEPAGADNIRKGFMLEPNDEVSLFTAGCLDISEGKLIDSFEKFSKSVGLRGTFFEDIIRIYIEQEKRADMAVEIASNDTKRLRYVIRTLSKDDNFSDEKQIAYLKLVELTEQKILKNTVSADDLVFIGDYYYNNHNGSSAIRYFSKAIDADYGNPYLRFKLARALTDNGQAIEAMKQLRVCLKLKPKYRSAENLLAELSVRPEVIKHNISEAQ